MQSTKMTEASTGKDRGCDVILTAVAGGASGISGVSGVEEKLAEFICSDKNWVSVLRQRIVDSNA